MVSRMNRFLAVVFMSCCCISVMQAAARPKTGNNRVPVKGSQGGAPRRHDVDLDLLETFCHTICNDVQTRTMMTCKTFCKDVITRTDICLLPKDTGLCLPGTLLPGFFYNSATGACEYFESESCGGTANNFETMEACMARCGGSSPTPSTDCFDKEADVCSKFQLDDPRYQKAYCRGITPTGRAWFLENCKQSCGVCTGPGKSRLHLLEKRLGPAIAKNCQDAIPNCRDYGQSGCTGQYKHWAQLNCPKYCNLCPSDNTTPTPTCQDKIPNCKDYGQSGCAGQYKPWAEQNCKQFCNLCPPDTTNHNRVHVTGSQDGALRTPADNEEDADDADKYWFCDVCNFVWLDRCGTVCKDWSP